MWSWHFRNLEALRCTSLSCCRTQRNLAELRTVYRFNHFSTSLEKGAIIYRKLFGILQCIDLYFLLNNLYKSTKVTSSFISVHNQSKLKLKFYHSKSSQTSDLKYSSMNKSKKSILHNFWIVLHNFSDHIDIHIHIYTYISEIKHHIIELLPTIWNIFWHFCYKLYSQFYKVFSNVIRNTDSTNTKPLFPGKIKH